MAAKFLEFSPKRRMIFDKFFGKDGDEKCLKSILEHHFNFSIGVIAPSLSKQKLYESVCSVSLSNEFCCLAEVALVDIINVEFISSFVNPGSLPSFFQFPPRIVQGSVCALSHGTKIDTSDCASLLPGGILHLSLTKDTYECLGIQGKSSPFNKNLRFDIEINLLAPYFKPSKKYYERVLKGFTKAGLKFKFLFSTISSSHGDELCGQKLQEYFRSHAIIYETFTCKHELQEFSELHIPVILFNNEPFVEIDSECNSLAFHEWLGCVVCGIDCSKAGADSFVTTLSCPEPLYHGKASFCKWTGFLPSNTVCEVIKLSRELLERNPGVPWISLMIWGFSDSPVSWRDRQHGYFFSGDNHCTVVMFQNKQLWMYRTLGDHDQQP